jgi:hypothetical protein
MELGGRFCVAAISFHYHEDVFRFNLIYKEIL